MLSFLRRSGQHARWGVVNLYLRYRLERLKVPSLLSRVDIEISIMEKKWRSTQR